MNLQQYQTVTPLPDDVATQITQQIQRKIDESHTVDFFQKLQEQQQHQQVEGGDDTNDNCSDCSCHGHDMSPIIHSKILFSDLNVGECLGQGSFSSVFTIKSIPTKRKDIEGHYCNDNKDNDHGAQQCCNHSLPDDDKDIDCNSNCNSNCNNLVVKVLQPKLLNNPKLFANCAAGLIKEGMLLAALSHKNLLKVHGLSGMDASGYNTGRHDGFFLIMDRLQLTLKRQLALWRQEYREDQLRHLTPILGPYNCHHQHYTTTNNNNNSIVDRYHLGPRLEERIDILTQLADAVRYLHSHRILHRDLKPDNLALDADGVLKVFDLDIARIVPPPTCENDRDEQTFQLTRRMGSPRYMSPEVALGKRYNLKADVYAVGLLCHEVLTLQRPYADIADGFHHEYVFEHGLRPVIPPSWPVPIRVLLQQCWSPDLSYRPNMDHVLATVKKEFPSLLPHRDPPSKNNGKVNGSMLKKTNSGYKSRTSSITSAISGAILGKLGRRRASMMVRHHKHRGGDTVLLDSQ